MRFLRRWLATETPSALALVDVAFVLALLPHLLMLRLPMLFYMVLALVVIVRGGSAGKATLWSFALGGFAAIALSFLGTFNFVGFSELRNFIQLVVSLLIVAVTLQRLTRTVNLYLAISPMLMLALSYFFYNTVFMLAYAIFALFVFTLLLLWMRMHSALVEALRATAMLFMMALPVVVVLFLTFPRISFETKDFGFKDTASLRTGHDGEMHMGSEALLVPSKKVAMEVWFEGEMPPESRLYFRGSVLYNDRGDVWVPIKYRRDLNRLSRITRPDAVAYRITLYPHKKPWLYLLDYPFSISRKANFTRDQIAFWDTPIDGVFRYEAASQLTEGTARDVEPHILDAALEWQRGRDPQSERAMAAIAAEHPDAEGRMEALNAWYRSLGLTYTLKPDAIDPDAPTDGLLFGTKKGYCVHFAASYATLARMLGIPSRVVTGFRGDMKNRMENYLVVREEDAHAWVELHLQGRGWMRVDPTGFALLNEAAVQQAATTAAAAQGTQSRLQQLLAQADLYVMYMKFKIQKWVLFYDRSRQVRLLKELMNDAVLVLQFVAAFAMLVAAGIAAYVLLRREPCGDRIACAMKRLLATLEGAGVVKEHGEDMRHFLRRASQTLGIDLSGVDRLYHDLRYGGGDVGRVAELEARCSRFKV